MPPVLLFGHGVPLQAGCLRGLRLRDITRERHVEPDSSRIAPLLEPFLDPFVRSFLFGLERRAYDDAARIVIWRQGAGALHAFRYAEELRRLGLLPPGPPILLWNRAASRGPGASRFDQRQDAALAQALSGLARGTDPDRIRDRQGILADWARWQHEAWISGAAAFGARLAARRGEAPDLTPGAPRGGCRLALAGSPLGGDGLHRWLDRQGALVLDLQGPDEPSGDPADLLRLHRIGHLVWQVDPADDLHGWHAPRLRRICQELDIRFTDLGFLPTWPDPADLPEALPCD